MVARTLYKQAGGDESLLINITADPQIVSLISFRKLDTGRFKLPGFLIDINVMPKQIVC